MTWRFREFEVCNSVGLFEPLGDNGGIKQLSIFITSTREQKGEQNKLKTKCARETNGEFYAGMLELQRCVLVCWFRLWKRVNVFQRFFFGRKIIWIFAPRQAWSELQSDFGKNKCQRVWRPVPTVVVYYYQRWIKFLFMFHCILPSPGNIENTDFYRTPATWNCNWLRIKIVTQTLGERRAQGENKNKT